MDVGLSGIECFKGRISCLYYLSVYYKHEVYKLRALSESCDENEPVHFTISCVG